MSGRLIEKHGGYRRLCSFTFATLIHLETIAFCKRFIPWQEDTLGKTAGDGYAIGSDPAAGVGFSGRRRLSREDVSFQS